MDDMAEACWEAIDEFAPGEKAILGGCSVARRSRRSCTISDRTKTAALVLCGTGYNPTKEFPRSASITIPPKASVIAGVIPLKT